MKDKNKNSAVSAGIAILEIASEIGLLYFRSMELAGLTQEQKDAHIAETRARFQASRQEPLEAPPD